MTLATRIDHLAEGLTNEYALADGFKQWEAKHMDYAKEIASNPTHVSVMFVYFEDEVTGEEHELQIFWDLVNMRNSIEVDDIEVFSGDISEESIIFWNYDEILDDAFARIRQFTPYKPR